MDVIIEKFNSTFIVADRYKLFVEGFQNTVIIAIGAAIIGIIIGALVAMVRVYRAQTGRLKWLDRLLGAYVAVFRGTPVIVQLMIMYFIVLVSIDNALIIAVIAMGINSGAYVSEHFRAGIMSIDVGQTEAGRSLGLPAFKVLLLVVMPQAVKNILPTLGNEFILLIKDTSVVGAYLPLRELAKAGANVRANTADPYFSLLFIALVYFLMVMGVTRLLQILERRLRRSDRG